MRWIRLGVSVAGQIVSWGGFLAYVLDIPSPMQGKSAHGLVAFMTSTPAVLALCVVGMIVTGPLLWTSGWWWPRILRVFKKDHIKLTVPRLNDWLAPDGSITLKQAAFLWLGLPAQEPIPPEVQDRIAVFQNAIDQGSLRRLLRHDENTEKNLAILRFLTSDSTPISTRVLPSELRRWAEKTGHVPNFLLEVCDDKGN